MHKLTQSLGVGAQFGGKYFCHDVRVIRLPRHGASLPIGLGVSCSADRQALGKITRDGVFLEAAGAQPGEISAGDRRGDARRRGRRRSTSTRPMEDILAALSQASDQDAALAHRPDDRRARSRACQAARAAGGRAGAARLFQEPSGLLRRPGEDAGGLRLGLVRPDHGRAHGFLRRSISRPPAARW